MSVDKNRFHSNQAVPTLLVGTYREALATKLPTLKLQDLGLLFLPGVTDYRGLQQLARTTNAVHRTAFGS
jgi:hypothetical protein